jgi:hypothetical protein
MSEEISLYSWRLVRRRGRGEMLERMGWLDFWEGEERVAVRGHRGGVSAEEMQRLKIWLRSSPGRVVRVGGGDMVGGVCDGIREIAGKNVNWGSTVGLLWIREKERNEEIVVLKLRELGLCSGSSAVSGWSMVRLDPTRLNAMLPAGLELDQPKCPQKKKPNLNSRRFLKRYLPSPFKDWVQLSLKTAVRMHVIHITWNVPVDNPGIVPELFDLFIS